MFILRFAVLSCAFYLGIAFLLQAGLFVLAYMNRIIMVPVNRLAFAILFGIIWLVSFTIAWPIFYSAFKSKFLIPPSKL